MPKVSVIIPVYNVEKYLRECLDSVVNQTLKDIEIICINDGSTDNSLKIINEYATKDARIKVISQKNKGLSAARNVGIEIAQGEFIGFFDADDKIDPDFYEKLYNNAKKYNAEIAAGSIFRIKGHKHKFLLKIKRVKVLNNTAKKYKALNLPHWSFVWNKIYNTKVLKELGLKFPEGKLYEDIVFTHEIIHRTKKLVVVPNIKYHYYINSHSITNNLTEKHHKDLLEASIKIQQFAQENNICKAIGKHWHSELIYETTFHNIPIFTIYQYGKYLQYRILNIPIFCKAEVKKNAQN